MILDAASTVVDFPARTLFSRATRDPTKNHDITKRDRSPGKIRLIIGMYTYCCEISYGSDELAINY